MYFKYSLSNRQSIIGIKREFDAFISSFVLLSSTLGTLRASKAGCSICIPTFYRAAPGPVSQNWINELLSMFFARELSLRPLNVPYIEMSLIASHLIGINRDFGVFTDCSKPFEPLLQAGGVYIIQSSLLRSGHQIWIQSVERPL